jgi:hypothetical protein
MTSSALLLLLAAQSPPSPEGVEFFEKKIRPLLVERCAECHAEGAKKIKGGLRVDSREGLLRGGESGAAVVPGNPEASLLLKALRWTDDNLQMPPKTALPKEQVDDVEAWIRMGAPDPRTAAAAHPVGLSIEEGRKFWSFRRPVEPAPGWTIDSLIGAALKAKGLEPAPEADARTLLRRVTYDLTGLPPTAEELDGFTTAGYEQAVDRLLASPRFGERWGRHWLDVVRYADTKEWVVDEERRLPYPWTYRDWVIRAFNEDVPFDRFVRLQLAADKIVRGDDKRDLAALGFLTVGRSFLNRQPDIIDDQIDVVTRGLLGLTAQCARCHDHKYDPIPTKDYYSLYGIFASTAKAKELPLLGEPPKTPEYEGFLKELAVREGEITKFREQRRDALVADLRRPERLTDYLLAVAELRGKDEKEARGFADRRKLNPGILKRWRERAAKADDPVFSLWAAYAALPEADFAAAAGKLSLPGLHPLVRESFAEAPASLREAADRFAALLASAPLAEVHRSVTEMPLAEVDQFLSGDERGKMRQMKRKVDEMAHFAGAPPRAMTVEDTPTPHSPKVFIRGNSGSTGEEVPRAFLSVLSPAERPAYKTGGRLELAEAIVARDNPLTARVWVNRAWQRLFGAGLVRTPSDFGTRGEPPTHPELLDGLAVRFLEDGGSTKKLLKLVVTSAAYRRSSTGAPSALDPENRLLARQNRRRLDLEATRDSLLAAAGRLDLAMGGRSLVLETAPYSTRRTVYGWIDRLNLANLYKTFDFALPDMHSPQRHVTTVPLQALFLMNSPFALEQARHLAARVPANDVDGLYRAVFGRAPSSEERRLGREFLEKAAPAPAPAVGWQYGTARWDGAAVTGFAPLPHYTGKAWQGGPKLPAPPTGWAMLDAAGGHAADQPDALVVRRWTAPRDGVVAVAGRLRHDAKGGDGVLGRLVSSRAGALAEWIACRDDVETAFEVEVVAGEILDFAVDCRADNNADSFQWAPSLRLGGEAWSATSGFSGPGEKAPAPLTAWEKYAQVLLETNEFVFLD